MAIVDLIMPKMGESIMEATVLKWYKHPGDSIKMDETLLDIATDKVDSEVPSTTAGVIAELLYKVNDVVPVGAVIARIDTDAASQTVAAAPVQEAAQSAPQPQPVAQPTPAPAIAVVENNGPRFYSPLVLNIAGQEGIGMAELENIPGTGNEGRVTKKDILNYVANRGNAAPVSAPQAAPAPVVAEPALATPVQSAPATTAPAKPVYTVPPSYTPAGGNV
jgi:2-oxoglutarate dehydrogenase E2 component (dihydrolipoamide succinyltransferase)